MSRSRRTGAARHYDTAEYRNMRALVKKGHLRCWVCDARATQVDHIPPLRTVRTGERWRGRLLPVCQPCNAGGRGERLAGSRRSPTPRIEWSRIW